jgi:hypothetical protein
MKALHRAVALGATAISVVMFVTPPPGITLSSSGLLSGTPTAPGTATFTVGVADSASPQQTNSQTFTIKVRILGAWTLCTYSSGSAGNGIDGVGRRAQPVRRDVRRPGQRHVRNGRRLKQRAELHPTLIG